MAKASPAPSRSGSPNDLDAYRRAPGAAWDRVLGRAPSFRSLRGLADDELELLR